jgi:hypothetical protein
MAALAELPSGAVGVDDSAHDNISRDILPSYLHKPTTAPPSDEFQVLCGNCTGRHRMRFHWWVQSCDDNAVHKAG